MSGGRSTISHAKGKRLAAQAGDISCIHAAGRALTDKFLLECKNYNDLNITGLLTKRGHLAEFWQQTVDEAARYSKLPFLIAKQNRQPTLICLSIAGLLQLAIPPEKAVLTAPPLGLYALNANDLFQTITPP